MEVLSVGYEVPGGSVEFVPLESSRSLLDADLVIFEPSLGEHSSRESYQGKLSLGEHESFVVKERLSHWRRELLGSFNAGKVVVLFLATPEEAYARTGTEEYSGTGRNRQVTVHVAPISSYDSLPIKIEDLVVASGSGVVPAGDLGYFAGFWQDFGPLLRYEVHFGGRFTKVLLNTRAGGRIVAAVFTKGNGAVVLIPPLAFDEAKLVKNDQWTAEARKVGLRLVTSLVEMAKALRSSQAITPPPEWALHENWRSDLERDLERQIGELSMQLDSLGIQRDQLRDDLALAGDLRRLLYEKGKQLENAIGDALRLLGFNAGPFRQGDSEFDSVFSSPEGRCLGEAEGKDSHAINIDKLSQLERNIQEDFAREEVSEHAKGVLFGNAYRLIEPSARNEFFTRKCRSGAARAQVALVRTPDLFPVARYLRSTNDSVFAKACRQAVFTAEGREVDFPSPPPDRPEDADTNVRESSLGD
jgi:hypothetical protein